MVQALLSGAAGPRFDFALARFRSDGAIDTGFGAQGVVTTAFGADDDYARSVIAARRPDRRGGPGLERDGLRLRDRALSLADGTLDAGFGDGGRLALDFFGAGDGANCVAT